MAFPSVPVDELNYPKEVLLSALIQSLRSDIAYAAPSGTGLDGVTGFVP